MNKIKKAGTVDTEKIKAKKSKVNKSRKKTIKPKIDSKRIKASKKAKMPKISIKYKEQQRYSKFVSKSQLQKHLDSRGNYIFTKAQQKQYNILKKRFNITPLEYLKLYYGIRKANAKGARLGKDNASLYHVKYSTKFNRVKDKYDYKVLMQSISKVLSRDYKEKRNAEFKRRFMQNIQYILTDKAARNVNDIIKNMTAEQLAQFIDENPDLEKVMYESKTDNFTSFDKEATSMIENRLLEFLGKDDVDVLTKYDVGSTDDLIR